MKTKVVFGLSVCAACVAITAAQQTANRTGVEQRALAEAIRSLPATEGRVIEEHLKDFKIDLDAVISRQAILSPSQDFRIQREVEDRLKPVPILNNVPQPVLPQTAFSLYRDLTAQETASLSERVRSVGRIETHAGGSAVSEGTGFVAPEGVIATNCHVVAAIAERVGSEWRLRGDTRIDFADDDRHRESTEYRITGIASHSAVRGLDVAVMTVERSSVDRSNVLPLPLPIAPTRLVQNGEPTLVGVIGYPDLPKATEPLFRQLRGRTRSTKLYSPGAVLSVESLGNVDVLLHVANTMKGSSGSPVLNRGDLNVIGVHNCCTGGALPTASVALPCAHMLVNRPFRNSAISAWSLRGDAAMAPFFSSPGATGND